MNTLVIVLIAAVCLFGAYMLYGRWLANKWGIDPSAKTPAVVHEDGRDYVPTDGWTVFAHQFSSIAGAGPVTGAIQAAAFGWLPVLLWVLLGGVFFGAVTDFGALYASVKNDGKSMGMLIEKYIGKLGRKLFLLFCLPWLCIRFMQLSPLSFARVQLLTSLMLFVSNALPNVAGMGSIETAFLLLYSSFLPSGEVMSVLMLYRIASYYFVFAASAVGFFLAQRRLTRTPPKED